MLKRMECHALMGLGVATGICLGSAGGFGVADGQAASWVTSTSLGGAVVLVQSAPQSVEEEEARRRRDQAMEEARRQAEADRAKAAAEARERAPKDAEEGAPRQRQQSPRRAPDVGRTGPFTEHRRAGLGLLPAPVLLHL